MFLTPQQLTSLSRPQLEAIYSRFTLKQLEREKARRDANPDPWEQYREEPYRFITEGLGQCTAPSWRNWRTVLRAAYGHPLDDEELAFFRTVAERDPPTHRVRELWLIIGRRGGKDSMASLIAMHAARYADTSMLRPGERALVACFATDKDQAGIVHGYIRGYFEEDPKLLEWLEKDGLSESYRAPIRLKRRVDVQVVTNNFRAPRGRPIAAAVFDECLIAGTRVETSVGPKLIKDVCVGDMVWTRRGPCRVLERRQTAISADLWRVDFSNGSHLVGTASHPVYTFNRGFVPLYCLEYKDEVLDWKQNAAQIANLKSTREVNDVNLAQCELDSVSDSLTYHQLTECKSSNGVDSAGILTQMGITRIGMENYSTAKFIWQSTDTFHRACTFIIRMKINEILRSIIWRRFPRATTWRNMGFVVLLLGISRSVRTICARVGESIGIVVRLSSELASNAARYFTPPACDLCFALPVATPNFTECKTKKNIIERLAKLLRSDITRENLNKVSVTSVSRLNRRAPVYNLSVADAEEYFANGILVHNCGFWRSDDSASPDVETYNAVLPGMATIPGAILIGISSPHMQKGLLYDKWRNHYGKETPEVLVIVAETRLMNPKIDEISPGLIDQALEDDPERAAAEYLAHWRRDLAPFVPREVIEGLVMRGRHEIPPSRAIEYRAFFDASGGTSDSMTLAIAHREPTGRGVLDCLREQRPPFDPSTTISEFAGTLRAYGVTTVTGDSYAGIWPAAEFSKHGVLYEASKESKSGIYLAFMPLLMSARVDLLDNRRMVEQLVGLERRAVRNARDTVDHAKGAHDDLANVAAGSLVMVTGDETRELWSAEDLR